MKRSPWQSALFLVVFSVFLFFVAGCGEKKDEPSGGKIPTETTTEPPPTPTEPPLPPPPLPPVELPPPAELPPPPPANAYTVGGTVSGITGSLVLRNNGADDLAVAASGSFTFATALADNSVYNVTVASLPASQSCVMANSSGNIAGANVTNVVVTCTTTPPPPPPPIPPPPPPPPITEPAQPASPVLIITTITMHETRLLWTPTVNQVVTNSGYRIYRTRISFSYPTELLATVGPEVTSYGDIFNLNLGEELVYYVVAFEGSFEATSNSVKVRIPGYFPAPVISFEWPLDGALISGLTEVVINTRPNFTISSIASPPAKADLFIDGVLVASKAPATQSPNPFNGAYLTGSLQWILFEIDTSGLAEGIHTLSADVTDMEGRVQNISIAVEVNAALLRKRALNFLSVNFASLSFLNQNYGGIALKWDTLPIRIEVNKQFTEEVFTAVQEATTFWTRHTGVPFDVVWGSDVLVDTASSCFSIGSITWSKAIRIQPVADASIDACGVTASAIYARSFITWKVPAGTMNAMLIELTDRATGPPPLHLTELSDPAILGGTHLKLFGAIARELMYSFPTNPTWKVLADPWGKIALEGVMQTPKYCDHTYSSVYCFSGNGIRSSAVLGEAIRILYSEFLPGQTIPLPVP